MRRARTENVGGPLHRLYARQPEEIVLYCAFGQWSAIALHSARQHGFGQMRHLAGGMVAWMRAKGMVGPVTQD